MRKKQTILTGCIVLVCALGLFLWALISPIADDYYWLYNRDTDHNLAFAFATALRINHSAAYDMVDPTLIPRLDEWMSVHQKVRCKRKPSTALAGSGTNEGYKIVFECYGTNNKWLYFMVDDIVIDEMKIIDWGEVKDE